MLRSKITQYLEPTISLVENSIGEVDEPIGSGNVTIMDEAGSIVPPPIPNRPSPTVNRYSYRQAIYSQNILCSNAEVDWSERRYIVTCLLFTCLGSLLFSHWVWYFMVWTLALYSFFDDTCRCCIVDAESFFLWETLRKKVQFLLY